ncbi:phage tail protein [bacterium]|nr:phage tail protein [bacterium]
MAEQYASFVVTNAGRDIIARIIAGLNITFSRIAIGDSYDYDTENFINKTSLNNEVKSLSISNMQISSSNVVELTAEFGKSDIEDAFWYREIGIYIIDPDDETNEILFAYGNRNDAAEYITPHIQNYAVLKNIKCFVSVGASANVNILISTSQTANTINFASADWILDEASDIYKLELGNILESLKVFKTTETGKIETSIVDITRDASNNTILKSLTAFDGCVVSI